MERSSWVLSPQGRTRECSPKLEWLPLRPAPHARTRAHARLHAKRTKNPFTSVKNRPHTQTKNIR
jgi:hypothetical protein